MEKKTIGLFGLGSFGQVMVEHLSPFFEIIACDPAPDAKAYAETQGGVTMKPMEEVAAADVVIVGVPVPAMENLLEQIKDHVKPGALVMDVGSVKVYPSQWMDRLLPSTVDVICTHPLFGRRGASQGTKGLRMVLCPLRGPTVDQRMERLSAFVQEKFGLDVIVTTPDQHDLEMAYIQGLPHMISKVLINMEPLPRRMMTPNYNLFLQSIDVVRLDTDDLFMAIMRDNPYSKKVRDIFFSEAEKLVKAIDAVS